MTDNNLARLLDGVTRYAYVYNNENCEWELTTLRDDGQYVRYDDILAALEAAPVPDMGEAAGKVLERPRLFSNLTSHEAADTIRALIALATAQAAQIAGLTKERDNLADKLELERALTDGAHRRAKAAEAEAATLRAEVERLRGVVERIDQWADAYPLEVFAEPDFAKAEEVLKAAGLSLSAISASNMRHVIEGVKAITRAALEGKANE